MDIYPPKRNELGRFPKGVSGNPAGRRGMPPEVIEALEVGSEKAARRLVELVDSADPRVAAAAATAVLDRLYGKPNVSLDATVRQENIGEVHLQLMEEIRQRRAARLAAEANNN